MGFEKINSGRGGGTIGGARLRGQYWLEGSEQSGLKIHIGSRDDLSKESGRSQSTRRRQPSRVDPAALQEKGKSKSKGESTIGRRQDVQNEQQQQSNA